MAELIDVLTPPMSLCPTFTVNTGVLSVVIPDAVNYVAMMASNGISNRFVNGDSFELLSAGYFIPERFVLYNKTGAGGNDVPCPVIAFQAYKITSAIGVTLTQIGTGGRLKCPFPNYETAMGCFINSALSIGEPFRIEIKFPFPSGLGGGQCQVSMVNVPAALNGVVFTVIPWIKILHNFPLT
jgi:hypothetical protein